MNQTFARWYDFERLPQNHFLNRLGWLAHKRNGPILKGTFKIVPTGGRYVEESTFDRSPWSKTDSKSPYQENARLSKMNQLPIIYQERFTFGPFFDPLRISIHFLKRFTFGQFFDPLRISIHFLKQFTFDPKSKFSKSAPKNVSNIFEFSSLEFF